MRNLNFVKLAGDVFNILSTEKLDYYDGINFKSTDTSKRNGLHSDIRLNEWYIKDKDNLYIELAGYNAETEQDLYIQIKYSINENKINITFGHVGRIPFDEFKNQVYQLLDLIK